MSTDIAFQNLATDESDTPAYRILPHNMDAEQGLLGVLLVDNRAVEKMGDHLMADHFFMPAHQRIFTAIRKRGVAANVIMSVSLIGVSLPTFLIGIVLIYVFSVELGWLPSVGRGEVVQIGWWSTGVLTESGLKALILPSITLGLYQMTLIMRLVRSEMLEVLRQDYIRFARARGLRERAVNFRHALKNTLVPVITVTGLQLGSIIAFAIITETVFQWPGVGLLFINAIQFVDIPVMAAYLMLISVMFVAINLIVDLLYFAIDPRLRADGAGAH